MSSYLTWAKLMQITYIYALCTICKHEIMAINCKRHKKACSIICHTGKSLPFLHMLSWNIWWKTCSASLSQAVWKKKKKRNDKNLKASSEQRAASQLSTSPAIFSYLHEKLGAFRHEQLEDEGRREAGKGAENHKQPPALKVQRAHREMGPGCWNHQPGQTCEHGHSFLMTFCIGNVLIRFFPSWHWLWLLNLLAYLLIQTN